MSRYYETLFIIRPSADDAVVEAAVAAARTHIEAGGGEVLREHNWGKRKLAYQVANFSEGIYAQVNFTAGADYPKTLEQMFRLHDDVIRDMVIRTEGPPPEEFPDYLPDEEARRHREEEQRSEGRDYDRSDRGDRPNRGGGRDYDRSDRGDRPDRGEGRDHDRPDKRADRPNSGQPDSEPTPAADDAAPADSQ